MTQLNVVPLFKPTHIEWAAQRVDDEVDFKELIKNKVVGAIAEGLDKKAVEITLLALNAKVSQYVPDDYKDNIHSALDDVIDGDGDYTEAVNEALDLLGEILDDVNVNDTVNTILSALIELLRVGLLSMI